MYTKNHKKIIDWLIEHETIHYYQCEALDMDLWTYLDVTGDLSNRNVIRHDRVQITKPKSQTETIVNQYELTNQARIINGLKPKNK